MIKSFIRFALVAGVIFASGCQIILPHQRFDEITVQVKGDEDGLLRACLINQLAFAGYRISESSCLNLKVESIEVEDRDMGFQKKSNFKRAGIRASEADLIHSARVTLINSGKKSEILGHQKIRAWNCFDFASDRLNQNQLSFSKGALTIRSEARKFALEELRHQLARKMVGWAESILQEEAFQSSSEAAFPKGGTEQIILPYIDQNTLQDF